jgi:circadian clock protein KaiC
MNKKNKTVGPPKIPTGIPGFDQLTGGGLAANRTTLVYGGPGSGKTVFALQALVSGAKRGEPGIFVSFDEHPRQLMENGASFGWNLDELEKKHLVFLDARMRPTLVKTGRCELAGMLAGLRAVANEMGARRIVFDSIDVLLTLLDNHLAEMEEVFRLRDWIFENELTAILTADLHSGEAIAAQRDAYLQFVADCTVALEYRLAAGAAMRHLRVVKYRGSSFVEKEIPFVIAASGIEVLAPPPSSAVRTGPLGPEIEKARKELTSRIQALDRFLEMKQAELDFLMERESARAALPPEPMPGAAVNRGETPVPSSARKD